MACDESLVRSWLICWFSSPNVISKQILGVQTYRTSCLFSLSALQFYGFNGDRDRLKNRSRERRGSVCFFWTLYKHIRTPLERERVRERVFGKEQKTKMCEVFPRLCCSLAAEEAMKADAAAEVETEPRGPALFHCVTSAFRTHSGA